MELGMERFEDIDAWQEARRLAAAVYQETTQRPFSRDFSLKNQICGAARSVPANIAEGFERNNLAEFRNFLRYAKASCAEVKSDCYLAFDVGYIDEARFHALLAQTNSVAGLIRKLDHSLEKKLGTRHPAPGTKSQYPTSDSESHPGT